MLPCKYCINLKRKVLLLSLHPWAQMISHCSTSLRRFPEPLPCRRACRHACRSRRAPCAVLPRSTNPTPRSKRCQLEVSPGFIPACGQLFTNPVMVTKRCRTPKGREKKQKKTPSVWISSASAWICCDEAMGFSQVQAMPATVLETLLVRCKAPRHSKWTGKHDSNWWTLLASELNKLYNPEFLGFARSTANVRLVKVRITK